ncbi:hypothetical protein D3C83_03340 [compost metagenome]
MRKKGSGAAKSGHDLIGDEMHAVAVAQRARAPQILGVVHRHAARALDQRLHDQRRGFGVMLREVPLERLRAAGGEIARRLARFRLPPVGARHLRAVAQQRRIGVLEQRDVGDRKRARRLAVVAAGEAHEARFLRRAAIAPVVKAHLERDLGGGRAVAAVEAVAQRAARESRQPLREQHHRLVREARQHHVLERIELRGERRVDARLAVPEEIHPPRADRIEVALALEVVEPAALRARDRNERQRFVLLHLGARVPHRAPAAF